MKLKHRAPHAHAHTHWHSAYALKLLFCYCFSLDKQHTFIEMTQMMSKQNMREIFSLFSVLLAGKKIYLKKEKNIQRREKKWKKNVFQKSAIRNTHTQFTALKTHRNVEFVRIMKITSRKINCSVLLFFALSPTSNTFSRHFYPIAKKKQFSNQRLYFVVSFVLCLKYSTVSIHFFSSFRSHQTPSSCILLLFCSSSSSSFHFFLSETKYNRVF